MYYFIYDCMMYLIHTIVMNCLKDAIYLDLITRVSHTGSIILLKIFRRLYTMYTVTRCMYNIVTM